MEHNPWERMVYYDTWYGTQYSDIPAPEVFCRGLYRKSFAEKERAPPPMVRGGLSHGRLHHGGFVLVSSPILIRGFNLNQLGVLGFGVWGLGFGVWGLGFSDSIL